MLQADRAFVEAVAKGDKPALEKLLDADFTWTDLDGKTLTRAEALQDPPKPAISSEDAAQLKKYTYGEIGDVQVNLGRFHVLRVWVKRAGGWMAIVYQEVMSLDAPPSFAPGAGKDCENPCKMVPYIRKTKPSGKSSLPTPSSRLRPWPTIRRFSPPWWAMNSWRPAPIATRSPTSAAGWKTSTMRKWSGVAPTPLVSARMFDFGDAVLMTSQHQPDRGKPLHVTRVWVKRNGSWMETLSYQTSVKN